MFDAGKRRHGKYAPDGRAEIIGLFLEPSKFFQIYSLEILGGFGEYQRVTAEKAGKIAFFAGGAGFSGGRCWKQSLTGPDFGQEFVPTRGAAKIWWGLARDRGWVAAPVMFRSAADGKLPHIRGVLNWPIAGSRQAS